MKKIIFFIITFCITIGCSAAWPTKEITLIIPYAPGGVNDQIARYIQPDLESILRVPVVIENRPGGTNSVAINHVLSKPNDNHTFIISMDDFIVGPLYKDNKSYNEFKAINILGTVPYLLVGNKTTSIDNFKNQIKNKATVNIGNNGVNGGAHLWINSLKSSLIINSVAYKGSAPMLSDVIAGHTSYGVSSIASSYPMVQSQQVIPIMQSGVRRSSTYPAVPTQSELGFKGPTAVTWFGIFTKNDTSNTASKKFSEASRIIIANNVKIQEFQNTGMDITNLGYSESDVFFKQQIKHFEINR